MEECNNCNKTRNCCEIVAKCVCGRNLLTNKYLSKHGKLAHIDTVLNNIYPDYLNGESMRHLSKKYSIGNTTLSRYFKILNLKKRSPSESAKLKKPVISKYDKLNWAEIFEKYKDTSLNKLSDMFDIPQTTLTRQLLKRGYKLRSKEETNKLISVNSVAFKNKIKLDAKLVRYMYYNTNESVGSLAKTFGVGGRSLKHFMLDNGIEIKSLDVVSRERIEKIKEYNSANYGVEYSSQRCDVKKKILDSMLQKHGKHYLKTDEFKEKSKKTNIERYGCEYPSQNQEIMALAQKTNLERYGYRSILCDKEKMQSAMQSKYGSKHTMHVESIARKVKDTCLERYNTESFMGSSYFAPHRIIRRNNIFAAKSKTLNEELLKYNYEMADEYSGIYGDDRKHKRYRIKCLKCNNVFIDDVFELPHCKVCNLGKRSQNEVLIFDELSKYTNSLCSVHNIIKSKKDNWLELDMYFPDKKIAVEYNGTYWHSGARGIARNYHTYKTEACLNTGIELIHIWEYHDIGKTLNRLKSKIGVHKTVMGARSCSLSEKDTKEFFNANHQDGSVGSSFAYSLIYDSEIVCALSVRRCGDSMEIARFATKSGFVVKYGFTRLMKYVLKRVKSMGYSSIITYADIDWTPDYTKSVYFKYGMQYLGKTGEQLSYCKGNKVFDRYHFQKHKLSEMFPSSFDPSLTANEILAKEGIYPIYRTGNHKFILNI